MAPPDISAHTTTSGRSLFGRSLSGRSLVNALATGAAALACAACAGQAQVQTAPALDRITEREVRALSSDGLRQQSDLAGRGVIPGTGEGGQATLVPLVDAPGRGTAVPAWWLPDEAALSLYARPPGDGLPVLEVTTTDGGEPSPVLWALAWGGAATASRSLGAALGKLAFELEAPAEAPAEAEVAAGVGLAAAGGDLPDLRPGAVAIGALAIDGTVLPTDDSLAQAERARSRGFDDIGLPAPLAAEAGGEQVGTISEATAFMTGETLPEPDPMPRPAMALREDSAARVLEAYESVRVAIAERWAGVAVLADQAPLPEPLADLVERARREARLAEEAAARGDAAAALARGRSALVAAAAATDAWSVVEAIRERELDRAREVLGRHRRLAARAAELLDDGDDGADDAPEVAAALRRVERLAAATRSAAHARAAQGAASAALALAEESEALPEADRRGDAVTEAATRAALSATMATARARDELLFADLVGALEAAVSPRLEAEPARLDHLATVLTAVGSAKLGAAEAGAGGSLAGPGPLAARHAQTAAERAAEPTRALAAAYVAFTDSWLLAAEVQSLGLVRSEGSGAIAGSDRPEALGALLEVADRRARQHARAASLVAESVPAAAELAYAEASALAQGDVRDRARALFAYWRASASAQLAVSIALR